MTSSISGLWATCGPDVSSQWPGLWSERETERTTVGTSNPRLTSSIMQLDVTFLIIIIIKFWESKMTESIIFSPDSEPLFSNWPQQPVIRSYFKCLTQCFLCFLKWWLNFIGCWHQHTNTQTHCQTTEPSFNNFPLCHRTPNYIFLGCFSLLNFFFCVGFFCNISALLSPLWFTVICNRSLRLVGWTADVLRSSVLTAALLSQLCDCAFLCSCLTTLSPPVISTGNTFHLGLLCEIIIN